MAKTGLCSTAVLSLLCLCCCNAVLVHGHAAGDRASESPLTSCAAVKPLFEMKNLSLEIPDTPVIGRALNVCTADVSCCTPQMEQALQQQVRRDFQALLHHNSRTLQGLLVSAADTVREHVWGLLRRSQNRTLSLVGVALWRSAAPARAAVSSLYARLRPHVDVPLQPATAAAAPALEEAVRAAFARLFPAVHLQQQAGRGARAWAPDYRDCLAQAAASELEPFGDAPARLARSLGRALEAARVLRQALLLGARVLAGADRVLTGQREDGDAAGGAASWAQCQAALMRMSYCPRCHGLPERVRPCAGLCLNVLRGCLTPHAAELDLPWNGYVEAAERLASAVADHDRGAVDEALRSIDAHFAEAIMIATEARPGLERKVKLSCGPHRWAVSAESAAATESPSVQSGERQPEGPPQEALSVKLRPFLASLTRSRGFYANLAESLCSDESFAETRDTADCWNGQRTGEYTKTVVAASISAQKYNPELAWAPHQPDMRIAELSDQLRHIKQVVVSQLAETPAAMSLTRYDGGSGSGDQPGDGWDDEEDEDSWSDQGSGSGEAPVVDQGVGRSATDDTVYMSPGDASEKPKGSDSRSTRSTVPLSWGLLIVAVYSTKMLTLCLHNV